MAWCWSPPKATCNPADSTQSSADGVSEKQRKENEERDAMAVELGNIAIDGASSLRAVNDPQASMNKATATPSKK